MKKTLVQRVAGTLVFAGLCLFVSTSQAQTTYTWDGETNGNWSTATNWLTNVAPVDASAAPENIVRFDSSSTLNLLTTMDLTSGFDLSQIIVTNPAGAITIRAVNNSSRTIDLIPNGSNPTIDMSAATQDLTFANQGSGTLTLNVSASGGSQTWNVAAGRTLTTVDVDGSTSNILTLTGGGTIILGGTSDNSSLRVATAGTGTLVTLAKTSTPGVHALGGNATSTIIAGTTMRITGTGGDQIYYQHDLLVDGLLDLNGNNEGIDGLSSTSGVTTGVISGGTGTSTLRINEAGTGGNYGGVIQDGGGVLSLAKVHTGTQVFAGDNTYTGSTLVSRGILQLLGANGAISNTSGIVIDGFGELRLDSRSTAGGFAAGVNNDRVEDTATVEMRGGVLSVYGVSTASVTERVGALSATLGNNIIRLSSDTVAGTTATGLTATSITRGTGSTVAVLADNLAVATNFGTATTGDVAYFRVVSGGVSASLLSGASGTGVNRDILIGFFGSGATGASTGTDFMTVESGGDGFDYLRPLLASEYATLADGQFVESAAQMSASTTLSQTSAYNALKIASGNLTIGAGKTLYLGGHAADALSSTVTEGAGMLVIAGGSGVTGGVSVLGTLDFGNREAILRATAGSPVIDARIAGTAGVTKTGTSTLILTNANTFTGAVTINEGILLLRNDRALGATGGNVFVNGSGVNTLLQMSTGINVTGENITLGASGGSTVGFGSAGGHNTWGGDVILANVALGGRQDSDSNIQAANESALTIRGNIYGAAGAAAPDPTYYGSDGNFTKRLSFNGSGTGVVNLLGVVSDTAAGATPTTVADRLRVHITGNAELNVNVANAMQVSGLMYLNQGYLRYTGTGNFYSASTATTDRLTMFDAVGTASQIALLLTEAGQSYYRRTASGSVDIQIGNGGSGAGTSANNVLIGGENETGVVTYGSGAQRLDFAPVNNGTDVGRFRDVRLYARQGGEVNFLMDFMDESGFSLNNEIGAVTKIGLGTVRLTGRSGVNNDVDGGAYVLGGTLLFDYGAVNQVKIQSTEGAQFTTAGGDLRLVKSSSGTITERMSGSLTVRAGGSEISVDAATGANVSLRLATNTGATITRQNGGTLNFVESGSGTSSILIGLAASVNTRLGSYATYGTANNTASSWAFIGTGNDLTAYVHNAGTEVDQFGAGLNTDLTANATLAGPTTTNSIRFNNTAVTQLDLGAGQLTVTEGGILVGSGHTGPLAIINGSITTGGANDVIIHNYGTGGVTISADISGSQPVTYAGTGVTTLVGAKTYTGTTYLNGGTVSIAADSSLGAAANAIFMNGGRLQTTTSFAITRGITIGGDAAYFETVGTGTTTTLSGVIARDVNFIYTEANNNIGGIVNAANTDNVGVGDIIKTGAGVLLITGNTNTFSGMVDVKQGTLQVQLADVGTAQTNLGTNESWIDGTIVRTGATLSFNKLGTASIAVMAEWIRMEAGSTLVATGGRFQANGIFDVQGDITVDIGSGANLDQQGGGGYMMGNGNITKTGAGAYILWANNNLFTGALTVENGILGARGQGQVTGSDFNEVITIGGTGTTAEYRRLSANEFTNNQLVEDHNIVVTGTGTKRLGYGNFSVPSGDDFIDFNGTLALNTNVELNVDTPGGTRAQTAYFRLNGSILGAANAATRVAGGTTGFTRTGVFELNADNTAWTGALTTGNTSNNVLNLHIVRLGGDDALLSDNNVTLLHNSTFQVAGHTVTAGNLATNGVVGAASNEIVENAAHADGTIGFTQASDGNWDALFRDGTPIGTIYELDGNTTVGRLNLVKEGTARATLTLDNQYTGSTTVNAGTLQVGSGGTAATRSVGDTGTGALTSILTVNASGRVAGTGTIQGIAGTTTHVVTGIISPGDVTTALADPTNTGTLDVVGNLDVQSGTIQLQAAGRSTYDFALGTYEAGSNDYNTHVSLNASAWETTATGTVRGDHDFLNIDGQLSLNGDSTVILSFVGYNPVAGDVFDLMDWLGVLGGTGFDAGTNFRNGGNGGGDLELPTLSGANLGYDVSLFASQGIIMVVSTVPEPGRMVLLVLGAVSWVLRRRRKLS